MYVNLELQKIQFLKLHDIFTILEMSCFFSMKLQVSKGDIEINNVILKQ